MGTRIVLERRNLLTYIDGSPELERFLTVLDALLVLVGTFDVLEDFRQFGAGPLYDRKDVRHFEKNVFPVSTLTCTCTLPVRVSY